MQFWMFAETGRLNMKYMDTDFKWGAGHHWPLAPRCWRPCSH